PLPLPCPSSQLPEHNKQVLQDATGKPLGTEICQAGMWWSCLVGAQVPLLRTSPVCSGGEMEE
ncbi:hypothetical protein N302_04921, partial [Corvus brachyrhynchos]